MPLLSKITIEISKLRCDELQYKVLLLGDVRLCIYIYKHIIVFWDLWESVEVFNRY